MIPSFSISRVMLKYATSSPVMTPGKDRERSSPARRARSVEGKHAALTLQGLM
jgi:hypothetical protein